MIKPLDYPGTFAEWYQNVERPRLEAITPEQRMLNDYSHTYGAVDDCIRCYDCEVLVTNGWKELCNA